MVCTKVDSMTTLEKDLDYTDSYFDLIQWHLRKFCLKYGAGLFYLNGKESPNTDILYKYVWNFYYIPNCYFNTIFNYISQIKYLGLGCFRVLDLAKTMNKINSILVPCI